MELPLITGANASPSHMQKLFAFNYYSNLDCIKTRVINRAHIYEQQLTVFAERLIRNAIKSLGQSTRQSQLCSYRRSLQSRVICSSCGCSSHSFRIPPFYSSSSPWGRSFQLLLLQPITANRASVCWFGPEPRLSSVLPTSERGPSGQSLG